MVSYQTPPKKGDNTQMADKHCETNACMQYGRIINKTD